MDYKIPISKKTLILIAILFIALILRVIYAYNLPLNPDEIRHLSIAKQCSLYPGTFNIPMGSEMTAHTMLTVYLIALGNWIGGGSIFVIRLIFILLSILGLIGLFFLARTFFGYRVALFSLIIASIDRYLIAWAPWLLEPGVIFIVPWIIYAFYNCLKSNKKRDWLLLGLFFGIGFNYFELILILLIPLALFLLFTCRARHALASPAAYLGAAVFLLMASPYILWNLKNNLPFLENIILKQYLEFGISPRFLLLYIGDLLICLKSTTWTIMFAGLGTYSPIYLPCHWVAGIIYLACLFYSIRFCKDERYSLLLSIVLGVAIPVSLLLPDESWSVFYYMNFTIFPMIILTAFIADRLFIVRWKKALIGGVLLYLSISILVFLAGPKWGYMSPCWEKSYIGKMHYFRNEVLFKKDNFKKARKLTKEAIKKHPDSAIAYWYQGRLAQQEDARVAAFKKALEIDPHNPLIILSQVDDLDREKEWSKARDLLRTLIMNGKDYFDIYKRLAETEYKLNNFNEAKKQAMVALGMKHDAYDLYMLLFFIKDAMGEEAAAYKALEIFITKTYVYPDEGYLEIAKTFVANNQFAKAISLLKKTVQINPNNKIAHNNLSVLCYHKLQFMAAIKHSDRAVDLGLKVNPEFLEMLKPHRKSQSDEI